MATPSTSSPGDLYKSQQARAEAPFWAGSCWSPCLSRSSEHGRIPAKGNGETPYTTHLPHQKAISLSPNIRTQKEPQQTHGYQEMITGNFFFGTREKYFCVKNKNSYVSLTLVSPVHISKCQQKKFTIGYNNLKKKICSCSKKGATMDLVRCGLCMSGEEQGSGPRR